MLVNFKQKGSIVYITLNRPETLNSISPDMLEELSKVLVEFRDNPELRVAIVTGAGKAFCAGADIKTMLPFLSEKARGKPWAIPATITRGMDLWKPLIAAINGPCLGGGLELALACDLRIAAENATFGTPEVKIGVIPGWGGTQRLTQFLPRSKAVELLLLGEIIDAQEAYRIGLVNKVVPLNELMPKAEEWARIIAANAPLAIQAAKKAIIKGADLPLNEGLRLEWELEEELLGSEDFKEGVKAFLEKRRPEFKGA